LGDGKRLHLHDGPIDLIVEVDASDTAVASAYRAAEHRFDGLLDELCRELVDLRRPACAATSFKSETAQRMQAAVLPFATRDFITPMAAVAGGVADTVLDAILSVRGGTIRRAYVNNGGDIAIFLAPGETFRVGLIDRPDRPSLLGRALIDANSGVGGIATSGCRGRSFTLGIADAVTVLAASAAEADAAATVIANAVDLLEHQGIVRQPAVDLQPDSDLGTRMVTVEVPPLTPGQIDKALGRGAVAATEVIKMGRALAACLHLQGTTRTIHGDERPRSNHQTRVTIGGSNAGNSAA
jgi:ApbE superfamily uncharacterized protein (UPF0280 family)